MTPPKYSRFLAEKIPGARLLLIEAAGHYVQLEQPDLVNAGIREFLGTLTIGFPERVSADRRPCGG